ncbi:hypothetical protein WN51_12817 [Melipona quadrifasciata]|uniref:Uncharacterized protein n=1 Tax=Melipona quadrifasciata TaxID=166423 RepID=A0A0N1ITQ0_9HYME|nr:hypothetical protein WN51_12817 [Melipona quadrifasciata]
MIKTRLVTFNQALSTEIHRKSRLDLTLDLDKIQHESNWIFETELSRGSINPRFRFIEMVKFNEIKNHEAFLNLTLSIIMSEKFLQRQRYKPRMKLNNNKKLHDLYPGTTRLTGRPRSNCSD